jgi:hypothetical protein
MTTITLLLGLKHLATHLRDPTTAARRWQELKAWVAAEREEEDGSNLH